MYDVHKLKIFLNDIGRGSNTKGFLCVPPCLCSSQKTDLHLLTHLNQKSAKPYKSLALKYSID